MVKGTIISSSIVKVIFIYAESLYYTCTALHWLSLMSFLLNFVTKLYHIKKSNMCTLSNVEIRELKTLSNIQKTQQWDQSTMRYRRLVKHSWCLQKCLRYFIMIPSHPDVSESIVFCRNYIQDLFAVWHCFFKLKDKSQNVTSKHNQLFSFSRFRPSVTLSF